MKSLAAFATSLLAVGAMAIPASARDTYVIDNAHIFSAATISAINSKVADFNATAHKEVFVDTEPTVDGSTPQAAAEKIFAAQQINGVLIYVAKSPKTIGVVPDAAARNFFPATSTSAIRSAIVSAFDSGNYNGGITNGVDLTLSQYRSHLGGLTRQRTSYAAPVGSGASARSKAGFNMSWIWTLIILAVVFFIVRGIFRAMAGPRMMPPGYGGGGPMMGGPGYGGGYGPGYGGGYGGGGGGFWSGLMGGLGGAFLGNELFGRRDDFGGGQQAGFDGNQQSSVDSSGFQNDAGQADMSNASFGGGGDSGGGWGGGGDSGGGGWGGGGDSGGGWGGGGGGGDFGGGGGGDSSGGGW